LENDILNVEKNNELTKEDKFTIVDEKISLNVNNYSYDEIFTIFIEEEKENKRLKDNDETISKILKSIPNGFEIVGKIAHFNLKDEYIKYKYFIGQLVLDKNPSISTVVNKVGKIENVYRTYEMEIIAGEENYNVEHKEGSVRFKFDLRKTYWCSRLQNERDRVLNLMKKNEVLCDAFCGVGPLALRACKKGVKVYANDLNPDAYEYLNNNIKLNKLDKDKSVIKTYNMDARVFIKTLVNLTKNSIDEDEENPDKIFPYDLHIDHIYMNLPKDAIEFMDIFVGLFKGCKENIYNKDNLPIIHVYGFAKTDNEPLECLKKRIAKAFKMKYELFKKECEKDIINIESVRDISNKKKVYCIDIKIPSIVAFGNYSPEEQKEDIKEENEEEDEI
jgi:tRNA (guanine37-N1)-methyltransferase